MKWLLIIVLMLFIGGCKTTPPIVQQVPVGSDTLIRQRPVPVVPKADSSLMEALLGCDSLNRVVLRELREQKSNSTSTSFNIDSTGRIEYRTVYRPDTIYVTVTDTIIRKEMPVMVPVVQEINRLTWWQKLFAWTGGATLLGLIIVIMQPVVRFVSKFL